MRDTPLLLGYYGDDFIGSVDALHTLAAAGVKAVLFTRAPSAEDLAAFPGTQAFGIAGRTRMMGVADAEGTLRLAFEAMRTSGAWLTHYRACSMDDPPPATDLLAVALDVGLNAFGAPAYVAGPMTQSPLARPFVRPAAEWVERVAAARSAAFRIGRGIIELTSTQQLADVAPALVDRDAAFVIGADDVVGAMCSAWQEMGIVTPAPLPPPGDAGPIVVACGSASAVTAAQICHAFDAGYTEVVLSPKALDAGEINNAMAGCVALVSRALEGGRNVVLHTNAGQHVPHTPQQDARLGSTLGHILRLSISRRPLRRVVLVGGDTAARAALSLGVSAAQVVTALGPGVAVCRIGSANKAVNGLEIVFKAGQVGGDDFFERVRTGTPL